MGETALASRLNLLPVKYIYEEIQHLKTLIWVFSKFVYWSYYWADQLVQYTVKYFKSNQRHC